MQMEQLGAAHLCFCSVLLISEELMSIPKLTHGILRILLQSECGSNRMRVLLLIVAVLPTSAAQPETVRFDHATAGELPADWTVAMTHAGAPPDWRIVPDESAPSPPNVLAQLSRDRTAGRFPLAIWGKALVQDGEISIAFKTVDGSIDQAAGIVWRYQDANNYYIVRANAIENNVVFYEVENGIRTSIAPKGLPSRPDGVKHVIPSGRWNHLKV